ncbi:MAG: site-specific DNA-methyltransferase [Chloroflexota bacterium]|nr:site-specific DNA-methyltransferase [Chloroflexota bacterium]MDE2651100.1 site-specific DNA-methyltransferase [Chloroflexota bacterium]
MAVAKSLWQFAETRLATSATIEPIDCRLGMARLLDNQASLILTDPPYFIDGMDNNWDSQRLKRRVKPGVIGSLPAGMKFSTEQGRSLQKFLYPIAKEWLRILRPGGFALVFSQNRLVHRSAIALEDAGFEIRDVLLWKYEGQAKAFTQDHFVRKSKLDEVEKERLIKKLGGRKTPQLKPQGEMIVLAQAPREGTFVQNWDKWETGLIDVADPFLDKGRFPGTVISVPKPKKRYGHITAKPVDLLRHLIRIFSAPEALVLDPFAGSGSTGVAALLEGREFLGFEIEEEMARRANERLVCYRGARRRVENGV